MNTLWAIEVTPLNGRGKPWLAHHTVSGRRKDAWISYQDGGHPEWIKEIKKRQRKGLLRAVKVTIQIKE